MNYQAFVNEPKAAWGSTWQLYQRALVRALRGAVWLWWFPLVFAVVVGNLERVIAGILPGGFAAGMVLGLVGLLVQSCYLAAIAAALNRDKIADLKELWQRTLAVAAPLIGVLFVIWIVSMVLGILQVGKLIGILLLVGYVVFNCVYEVAYLDGVGGLEAFSRAFEFIKEQWVFWFVGQLLLLVVMYFLFFPFGDIGKLHFVLMERTLLGEQLNSSADSVLPLFLMLIRKGSGFWHLLASALAVQLAFVIFAFRGALYLELKDSSIRSRIYKYKMT